MKGKEHIRQLSGLVQSLPRGEDQRPQRKKSSEGKKIVNRVGKVVNRNVVCSFGGGNKPMQRGKGETGFQKGKKNKSKTLEGSERSVIWEKKEYVRHPQMSSRASETKHLSNKRPHV